MGKSRPLYLTEIFASVQGETSLTGLPTTFIRLSGCNLRCSWCDTPYSFKRGQPWELDHVIADVTKKGCRHVCITGGEPLLQPGVHPLMRTLNDLGFILSLETGGSLPIQEVDPRTIIILDIKCPGSAMQHKNEWSNIPHLQKKDEVKFVIKDQQDYLYAKEICGRYELFDRVGHVLFSPVHGVLDPKIMVSWILEDRLPVRLNLQIHKTIWSPETRGV